MGLEAKDPGGLFVEQLFWKYVANMFAPKVAPNLRIILPTSPSRDPNPGLRWNGLLVAVTVGPEHNTKRQMLQMQWRCSHQ